MYGMLRLYRTTKIEDVCILCIPYMLDARTTDTQRENSLHCTAENSLPLPNCMVWRQHILSATSAQFFRYLRFMPSLGVRSPWVKLCRRGKQTSRITIRFLQFGIQEYVVCWSLLLVLGSASEPPAMLLCQHAKGPITGSCYKIIWTAATALSFFFNLNFYICLTI